MKTDKYAILSDAIKYLKAVQSEHSQLKQLNKFLEVSIMVSSRSLTSVQYTGIEKTAYACTACTVNVLKSLPIRYLVDLQTVMSANLTNLSEFTLRPDFYR